MQSLMAISPVSLPLSGGVEGLATAPDGGFALAFGDDAESGGQELSGDGCLVPAQALTLWVGVGATASAADRGGPVTEVARPAGSCAKGSGTFAEESSGSLVAVIAEERATAATVERADLPQPEGGFAAAESIDPDENGADGPARGEGLVLVPSVLTVRAADGDVREGAPAVPGRVASVAGGEGSVANATGSDMAPLEPVLASPTPRGLPVCGPVDRGDAVLAVSAPFPTWPAAFSSETGPDTGLAVLPDTGEAAGLSGTGQTADLHQAGPEVSGLVSAPPPRSTGIIPTVADLPPRMSAVLSASQKLMQRPSQSGSEPIPVLAPQEDAQPHPQQPGFWERLLAGVHPASVAEPVTVEPDASVLASAGFLSEVPRDSLGEALVPQSDAGLADEPVRQPTDQATLAGPALPATARRGPETTPSPTAPTQGHPLGQEPEAGSDLALAALAPGLLAPQGGNSAVVPQPGPLSVPQVAAQILPALSRNPEGTTDIALAPEELGHVRLKLKPDAANPDRMVVMITFERPETLDLFRRHAGDLAEALRTAGYSGVDIGFGQEGGGASGSDRPQRPAGTGFDKATASDGAGPIAPPPRLIAGASLDLRL